MPNIFIRTFHDHLHTILYIFIGQNESQLDFTDDLSKLKFRKSQFNLSVSLTPGELSAIFDTTVAQPKLNCKIKTCYYFF